MKKRFFSMLIAAIVIIAGMPFACLAEETTNENVALSSAEDSTTIENTDTDNNALASEEEITCGKVTGVKAKGISKSVIKVSWKKTENADGYKVYRWSSSKKKYVILKTIKSGNTLSYKNKGLDPNTTRTYKVKAYIDNDGKKIYGKLSAKAKGTTDPRTLRVKAWAYSGGGHTATGIKAKKGVIAVDPKVIKLGTKVYIPGYGNAVASDTGGAIKGKIIDVYFPKEKQCLKWGVQYVTIKIYD